MYSGIVDKLIDLQVVKADEREIYEYGMKILIWSILHTLAMLMIGTLISSIFSAVIFLVLYILLRECAGGYHADSEVKCFVMSSVLMTAAMAVEQGLSYVHDGIVAVLFFVSAFIIAWLAPVDDPNKPADEEEVMKFRRKSRILVGLYVGISGVLYVTGSEHSNTTVTVVLTECVMLIAGTRRSPRYKRQRR